MSKLTKVKNWLLVDLLGRILINYKGSSTGIGADSLKSLQEGAVYNTFVGEASGSSIVGAEDIAIGAENTGVGYGAGRHITTGKRNVVIGAEAGSLITTGNYNIMIGAQSSSATGEKTGELNTVVGYNAGKNWTTAIRNSFYGSDAGSATTTGCDNVAVGQAAMQDNTTGGGNTYLGAFAGTQTQSGGNNVGIGHSALFRNLDGEGNTAVGREAGLGVTQSGASPNNTTLLGFQAGRSQNGLNGVVFCGMQSGYKATAMNDTVLVGRASGFNLTTGSNNVMIGAASGDNETEGDKLVYLGHQAGRTLIDGQPATGITNSVAIGYRSQVSGSNQFQIGNSSQTPYAYSALQIRSDERDKVDQREISDELAVNLVKDIKACFYKLNLRDDYVDVVERDTGEVDEHGKPIIITETVVNENDGSKTRTRFHAGFLAGQVKDTLDKHGVDFGIYQDHSIKGGADVKTLAYEQMIPVLTQALKVALSRIDALEGKFNIDAA